MLQSVDVLIVGDVLQDVRVGSTMALDSLEFGQANLVNCGELVVGQGLNVEKGTKPILHSSWELEPFS